MLSRLATPTFRLLSTTAYLRMPKPYNPAEWRIVETSPSGLERNFVNDNTGEETWYTPEGMTAAQILEIPEAKKYWKDEAQAAKYIKAMAKEKAENGGKDVKDA